MRKIILMCSAGMSTSLLMTKMRDAAKAEGYECTVEAHAVSEAKKVGGDADIILLGPQIRFQLAKVKKQVSCPVEVIDMAAYGTMNGKAVIDEAREVLGD